MSSSSDSERIDPDAVSALYQEYGPELRAYVSTILRSDELGAEVLQIVFRKTLEQGHTARSNLRGWMLRVAMRECMLLRRKESREPALLQKAAWRRDVCESVEAPPQSDVVRKESVEGVRRAIEELPPEQQRVVRMRIYEEKTFAVIAAEIGAPLGTVLTRMRSAMQKLELALVRHADDPK